jgi:methionine aminotransferase
LSGATHVVTSLTLPDYRIDWDALRAAVTPRTRLLIINTPHNPTGTILTATDLEHLKALVAGTDILIVSDEVYEHLIFDGAQHESMARYPELAERSFIIGSFGKTYHVTGWKAGYAVAPAALSAEFRKVHQFVTFSTSTPMQYALADMMAAPERLRDLGPFYQAKRDLFLRLMEGSRFRPLPCRGSYFQLMEYSAITDEPDADFAIRLTKEFGVASIPTSSFLYRSAAPKVLRFCFAKKDDTLEQAAERLRRV